MLRKTLLVCGILSSVLYAAMTVLIAGQGPGYSSTSPTISELSAIAATTRRASAPINELVDRSIVADLDRLAAVLARQKPAWEPGTRQAYHALTLGFYEVS
jgi:hypothetical protein